MPPDHAHNGTRYPTGPTITVSSAGTPIAWCNGNFHTTPEAHADITWAIHTAAPVLINNLHLTPNARTPLGALAAMFARRPGRTVITQAPPHLVALIITGDYPHAYLTQEAHRVP